jgi:hypothetical protein
MAKGYIKSLQASDIAPDEVYFTYQGESKRHTLDEVLQLREEDWFSRGIALAKECNEHIVDASLDKLDKMRQTGTNHQLIAVACSVQHAKAVSSLYSERGYESAVIHSGMNDNERADVLRKLRSGILDCIVQVQMLGEGFDHPKLSVAAIFRPFRSLAPYVQFVGRVLRVVVQNDPRHPDNRGYVVSHVGLGMDRLLSDFRDMDREDKQFFDDLISGREPDVPAEVLNGSSRMRLRPEMIVHNEIVTSLFEQNFIDPDDETLLDELRVQAEALGFDADDFIAMIKKRAETGPRVMPASGPFPVLPQKQRQEAKKRLDEEVKQTAKILLNRLSLDINGMDIALRIMPGQATGNNFVAAVRLVNREVSKVMDCKPGERNRLTLEEFKIGLDSLEDILNSLTRSLKKRMSDNNGKKRKDSVSD